jgi:hypothetical protein
MTLAAFRVFVTDIAMVRLPILAGDGGRAGAITGLARRAGG